MIIGLHWIDFSILILYFLVTAYLGVYMGGKKTNNLGDFFVAGGKWGPAVSFIFVFASALAGNEAVVVAGEAYTSGLAGVWFWWSFLLATPVYYIFSIYFKRSRVYNICEFFEMRYNKNSSAMYAVIAGFVCIFLCGTFILAVGKILTGVTSLTLQQCVWIITLIVGAYIFSGGLMSSVLTNIVQGLMCIVFLVFVLLPFLFIEAGGMPALRAYSDANPHIWNLVDPSSMTIWTILALNLSALVGGIAFPSIFNWMSISKDEKTATQCGWGHLWKRIVTLVFAFYGILFAIYMPGLHDPELAWGIVMHQLLPVGLVGLLVASFFSAAMSSADANATTSSAMMVDYLYRRIINKKASMKHYLTAARLWALFAVVMAALTSSYITSIRDYVLLFMTLLSFLGIPIYFGVWWRRANNLGMWMSLSGGVFGYIAVVVYTMTSGDLNFVEAISPAFEKAVFLATSLSLIGMFVGVKLGSQSDDLKVKRFNVIMNTAIGKEEELVKSGIVLPALIDAGLVENKPEKLNVDYLLQLDRKYAEEKFFGLNSNLEFRQQKDFPGYYKGLFMITMSCALLVFLTWLLPKLIF